MMKWCRGCETDKPIEDFPVRSDTGKRTARCGKCLSRDRMWGRARSMPQLWTSQGWGPLDDARLLTLLALGMRDDAVAILLARTQDAVQMRRRRLARGHYAPLVRGLSRRTNTAWPRERVARLEGLVRQGFSRGEVAHKLRISRNAVIGAVHRHLPELVRRRRECAEARP